MFGGDALPGARELSPPARLNPGIGLLDQKRLNLAGMNPEAYQGRSMDGGLTDNLSPVNTKTLKQPKNTAIVANSTRVLPDTKVSRFYFPDLNRV